MAVTLVTQFDIERVKNIEAGISEWQQDEAAAALIASLPIFPFAS